MPFLTPLLSLASLGLRQTVEIIGKAFQITAHGGVAGLQPGDQFLQPGRDQIERIHMPDHVAKPPIVIQAVASVP